jgi:hypothetical protein
VEDNTLYQGCKMKTNDKLSWGVIIAAIIYFTSMVLRAYL